MIKEKNVTVTRTDINRNLQSVTFSIQSDMEGTFTLYAEMLTRGVPVPKVNQVEVDLHPGSNEVTMILEGMNAPEYQTAMLSWYIYRTEQGLGRAYFAFGTIHNRS